MKNSLLGLGTHPSGFGGFSADCAQLTITVLGSSSKEKLNVPAWTPLATQPWFIKGGKPIDAQKNDGKNPWKPWLIVFLMEKTLVTWKKPSEIC